MRFTCLDHCCLPLSLGLRNTTQLFFPTKPLRHFHSNCRGSTYCSPGLRYDYVWIQRCSCYAQDIRSRTTTNTCSSIFKRGSTEEMGGWIHERSERYAICVCFLPVATRKAHSIHYSWLGRVINFTPSWFSVIMGTGITSIILHNLPYQFNGLPTIALIVFVLNVVLFITFTLVYVTEFCRKSTMSWFVLVSSRWIGR